MIDRINHAKNRSAHKLRLVQLDVVSAVLGNNMLAVRR